MDDWLRHPGIRVVRETEEHARLWSELLRGAGSGGDLTTDAWIAAIALAHGASVLTLDSGAGPGRRSDPLTSKSVNTMTRPMAANDQLTIRSMSSRLRAALEQEATRRGESLDKTVLALLAERLGVAQATARIEHDDLDELAGTWSAAEATGFDRALRAQRQVDAKLWR